MYEGAYGLSPCVVAPELNDVEPEHGGGQRHGVAGGHHGAAGEVGAHGRGRCAELEDER